MAPETLRDLSDRLSALLADIDIAVRVRLRESEQHARGQLEDAARSDTRIGRAVAAALRWLAHPAADQPRSRRARSVHERLSGR